MEASKIFVPKNGILVSAGPEQEKHKFLPWAKKLQEIGVPLYATEGTSLFLADHGVQSTKVGWPGEKGIDPVELIRSKKVDFVLNIPKSLQKSELTHGRTIRQAATKFGCSLVTNMEKMIAYVQALDHHRDFYDLHKPLQLPNYK